MTSKNVANVGSIVTDKTIDSQSLLEMVNKARAILKRETDHIKEQPWGDSDWKSVFSYGKGILQ